MTQEITNLPSEPLTRNLVPHPDGPNEIQAAAPETPTVSLQRGAGVPPASLLPSLPSLPSVQPVTNLRHYLLTRKPTPDHTTEPALYLTLPTQQRDTVATLHRAYTLVQTLVNAGLSVNQACRKILPTIPTLHESRSRFRARYDAWTRTRDWTVLVDRSKAGGAWIERNATLPPEFITHCVTVIGNYKRADAKSEAIRSIYRHWRTGRNAKGEAKPIPGYGTWQAWYRQNHPGQTLPHEAPLPRGWGIGNILSQIRAHNLYPKAVEKLLLESSAAARAHLPQVRTSRAGLRFMERVQFDDVKTDFIVMDPHTHEVMDLWLLIAHDVATTITLGFGMRPARTRENGTQEHLTLADMRQLCGWLLERFGLPPYLMHWVLECGTATLTPGSAAALQELVGNRIALHYTSMHGGRGAGGYQERAKGNSRGKASLESLNRLHHIIGADLPGQTGPHYAVRPSTLVAQSKEALETLRLSQYLPEDIRGQCGYSLLTLEQARKNLFRIFDISNHRTDHHLEGFDDILEWYNGDTGLWLPQNTFPHSSDPNSPDLQIRKRKQSPIERAKHLVQTAGGLWTPVSADIIRAFYEHTAREVTIKTNGLIEFTMDGTRHEYAPPGKWHMAQPAGTRLLAYCHPDDPQYLHLTDGRGAFIGTWLKRSLCTDSLSIQAAIQYAESAVKQIRQQAEKLDLQKTDLETMRANNAQLFQDAGIHAAIESPRHSNTPAQSRIAQAFTAVQQTKQTTQKQNQQDAATSEALDEALSALLK